MQKRVDENRSTARSPMPGSRHDASSDSDRGFMNRSRFSFLFLPEVILTAVVFSFRIDHAAGQEVALSPMQATEVAKGYRAEALKLKPVVNDKNETIGRI